MSTLDENGLVIDRFPDIVSTIEATQKAEIPTAFVYDDSKLIYQLNSVVASRIADNAELIEAVYNAKRLSSATGVDLDYLGALKGITRFDDINSSTTNQRFTGQAGITIPTGSLFANPATNNRFTNTSNIILSASSCIDATLSVLTLLPSTAYEVTVNSVTYSVTSDPTPTAIGIVTDLADEINDDVSADVTASVVGNNLYLITDDETAPLSISVTTYIGFVSLTAEGYLESIVPGRIVAPADSVTQIVSTISGLTSTTNTVEYSVGRLREEDEDYRLRIASGQGNPGLGTVPSIEAYLLANVANIVDANVVENATEVVDGDGRPPHSYEVIVSGGENVDIAEAIWYSKGAGIELFGDITQVITDPRGRLRTVKFSRPVAINVAIDISYSLYDEESFPLNGEELMLNTVVSEITALGNGKDLILGRLYGPIYNAVGAGIDALTIRTQIITDPGDTPSGGSWVTTRTPASANEYISITNIDVYITQV